MCGIAGTVDFRGRMVESASRARMLDALAHRGPDSAGEYMSTDGRVFVWLGARRLRIIDLSATADQPVANEDGSVILVFNGEIYNFHELRKELEGRGHCFRSGGDTEVIAHLYEEFGLDCVCRLRGMFAFALWDCRRRRLLLARDRLGKKPLHYAETGGRIVFASEARAILHDPGVKREPNPDAIHHYLTFGYVPGPASAFRGLAKLPPAHYMVVDASGSRQVEYWRLRYQPKRAGDEAALGEELLDLLEESTRLRLISDVPVGVLLSGGLDSSAVAALARRATAGPLRTFTVAFSEPEYDESSYARAVAGHLGTDHEEVHIEPRWQDDLAAVAWHYGEPFADSSALPSWYVCRAARQSVTVALNGDGGDEAFAGYDRYLALRLSAFRDRAPRLVGAVAAGSARWMPGGSARSTTARVRRFVNSLALGPRQRSASFQSFFSAEQKDELYTRHFAAVVGSYDSQRILEETYDSTDASNLVEAAIHADVRSYLPDDLLVKMDIASMAHSLEVRSPFLDHHVAEFAARLPMGLKLKGLKQKYLLKRAVAPLLPAGIVGRKKRGFGVPLEQSFRSSLGDAARELLLGTRARAREYFDPAVVARYVEEHASGAASHQFLLWNLLMLELWHRTFIDQTPPLSAPSAV